MLLCGLLALSLPRVSSASIYDEFTGIRSAAMGGAHRAVGTSNDALMLNPAGMAMAKRYAVEMNYGYSKLDDLSRAQLSAIDSKSSPIAAGVGYTYVRGDDKGVDPGMHWVYFGSAFRIAQNLAFGFSTKHIRGSYKEEDIKKEVEVYTRDNGLQLIVGNMFSFGLSYHNLVETDVPELTPPTVGVGLALGWRSLLFSADVDIDITDTDAPGFINRAGGEWFLQKTVPLRVGYTRQGFVDKDNIPGEENLVTLGLGYLNQAGSLDLSVMRSVALNNNWTCIGGLKFFL